ncbi:hypothetical protein TNCV_1448811 [Trichonephila clavipes]|nr:hypothetical protein TNCV_1448811 [Trichonephila clavipes]
MRATSNFSSGRGSLVVKVSDRGWLVTNSSPVPLKTRRVGKRCTLNLSRAQTSCRCCDGVVRGGGASSVLEKVVNRMMLTRTVGRCSPVVFLNIKISICELDRRNPETVGDRSPTHSIGDRYSNHPGLKSDADKK